jgi:hypothetical protein
MNFWFYRSALKAEMSALMEDFPKVSAWRERVAALGGGSTRADMTTGEAIEVARAATPAATDHITHDPRDPIGLAPGASAHVVADDYGRDPIAGTLVAVSLDRIVITREHERVGVVNVHFPRVGFNAISA